MEDSLGVLNVSSVIPVASKLILPINQNGMYCAANQIAQRFRI